MDPGRRVEEAQIGTGRAKGEVGGGDEECEAVAGGTGSGVGVRDDEGEVGGERSKAICSPIEELDGDIEEGSAGAGDGDGSVAGEADGAVGAAEVGVAEESEVVKGERLEGEVGVGGRGN